MGTAIICGLKKLNFYLCKLKLVNISKCDTKIKIRMDYDRL